MDRPYHYPGKELELFQEAVTWKKYFSKKIRPYIGKKVLEVGAGMGATTKILNDGSASVWTLLEPDEGLYGQLQANLQQLPSNVMPLKGTINEVGQNYDTVLYVDVLEHIGSDRDELARAAALMQPSGHLIVLSPAFQFLYSEFDRAIGHCKRYSRKELKAMTPAGLELVSCRFLDSFGFMASVMNRWFLRQDYPTKKQVLFWDRRLVPLSKILDPLFQHSFGKSILAVWQKQ